MDTRAALLASRPGARAYADALAAMPSSLVGAAGRLARIAIYPVKGLGGLALERARVAHEGLVDPLTGLVDRGAMLAVRRPGTTGEGETYDAVALSNRSEATLALTKASLSGGALVYEAPGVAPLRLAPSALAPARGPALRVKLGYEGAPVLDGVVDDGPLAAWVRDLLRAHPAPRRYAPEDVVAIRRGPQHRRPVAERHRAGEHASTVYGDGAHALVASSTTLAWMNAHLAREGQRTIAMEPFRPNLVVDGLPPNAEDLVHEASILAPDGPVRLVFASMCVRCDATRVDPATGTRPDAQPLAWLARNRPPRDADANAATFAMNAVFPSETQGRDIRVGESVTVTQER